ncbi:hypothetical protein C8Q73DRAFT_770579 [Cubamyces lactineus]|nr:hypothetical protein C8Q73DRAFT_770579 [Cubamyces lactineus]
MMSPPAHPDAAENWDEDFEFTQGSSSHSHSHSLSSTQHDPATTTSPVTTATPSTGLSSASTAATSAAMVVESGPDSPPSTPLSKDKKNTVPLAHWAEPGPSTPPKRPLLPLQPHAALTENWDDDFQDTDSPGPAARRQHNHQHHQHSAHHPLARAASSETGESRETGGGGGGDSPMIENWDDDFEDAAARSAGVPSPRRRMTPRKRGSWPESDDEDGGDDEYGFADGEREEDRTVTSRSRGLHMPFQLPMDPPPPPVPPLPSPFPRSPTASVFSVPVSSTGRDSVTGYSYSSTAHLALRPTVSGGSAARLALLPPSPPIHRERRRLRKKSRPPHHFEDGIFELDDRAEVVDPPARPVTPEQKKPRGDNNASTDDAAPDVGNTSTSGKTPLLSRIGSVGKKWGAAARKKRASTGPNEVTLREAPAGAERQAESEGSSRPTSFIASTSPGGSHVRSGWFFRGGGGGHGPPGSPPTREGALKSEKSVERLLHLMRAERERGDRAEPEPGSPSSRMGVQRRHGGHAREGTAGSSALPQDLTEAVDGNGVPTSTLLFGAGPRRPTSMQIAQSSSGSSWSTRPPVPRHASYGDGRHRRPVTPTTSSRASSKQRSASASVEDVHRSKKSSTATRETLDDRSSDAHSSSQHHDRPPLPLPPEPTTAEKEKEKEKGSRRFMGGMRRISLVGGSKHKRNKSTAPEPTKEKEPEPQPGRVSPLPKDTLHDQSTPRPPSRVVRSSQDVLLPPIELQPPSPPRPKVGRKTPPSGPGTTPTRRSLNGTRPTLEPSRSHPTLSPRTSLSQTSSQETSLPTIPSPLPSPTRPKLSTSPVQTASLGRTAQPPKERDTPSNSAVLRRNSLGDLKIPARISQAQVSLRRDLSMVRDFASSVEQLKQLQSTYTSLVGRVREMLSDPQESQSRPVSPSFIHLPKPALRTRSNTNPAANSGLNRNQLNTAFLNIEAKYRLSWECAELLIDLGGGGTPNQAPTSAPPSSSQSAPAVPTSVDGRKSRERAITLAGDEQKPVITPAPPSVTSPPLASPPSQWRASTGRHDLSQRQLLLLREMLNNPDPNATLSFEPNIPEEDINRNWRWGDAMNSTVTLPSEESGGGHQYGTVPSPSKKRRTSRLGMRGLRDMLKSLKKSYSEQGQSPVLPRVPPSTSSISASTDSSLNLPRDSRPPSVAQRRRAKTSTGPESISSRRGEIHPNSPYGTTPSLPHKSSPRRPSLASIFRLGQKTKTATAGAGQSVDDLSSNAAGPSSSGSGHASGTSLGEELDEDWDRVESVSDLDHAARSLGLSSDGTATVRGKKGKSPYLFQREARQDATRRGPDASGSSIWSHGGSESPKKPSAIPPSTLQSYQRSIKLSDVREAGEGEQSEHTARAPSRSKNRQSAPSPSPRRPPSRSRKNPTGSVRSAPPQPWGTPSPDLATGPLPDVKLAMAPENIKPLLENAREVHARCSDCIAELEALLHSATSSSSATTVAVGAAPAQA